MKRTNKLFLLVMAICLCFALAVTASAEEIVDSGSCGDNLTWILNNDGKLTISGTGPMDDYRSTAEIPWNDYGWNTTDYSKLTSVIISEGVTSIGNMAFYSCRGIISVEIASTVERIGSNAFGNCRNLKSVVIPQSVKAIDQDAFWCCEGLQELIILEGVEVIGQSAFYGCIELSDVALPYSVCEIGDLAFGSFEFLPGHLKEIYIKNPQCVIVDNGYGDALGDPQLTTVYAPSGSFAAKYAKLYRYKFIDEDFSSDYSLFVDVGDIELVAENNNYATYRLSVSVENSNKTNIVTNVSVILDAGEGATITGEDQIQTTDILMAGKTATYTWTLRIDRSNYPDGGPYYFVVMADSDETELTVIKGTISLEATNLLSNELDFSTDVWKFDNFSDAPCPIQDLHKNALLAGLSKAEKRSMESYLQTIGDGGHCYGMSASVILDKMNAVDLENFTGSDTIRDASFTEMTNSIICYYQATQMLETPRAATQYYMSISPAEQLALLAEKTDAVKSGGCPVLLSYGADSWGAHAVVAYALESGTFRSSTTARTYNRRILIYDCNSADIWGNVQWNPDYCLLFNVGTGEWEIPAYAKSGVISTNKDAYLKRCASSLSLIDPQNYDAGLFNYVAELIYKEDSVVLVEETESGYSWRIDGSSGNVIGDTDLIVYHTDGTYDSETPPDIHVVLPNEQSEYRVSAVSGEPEKLSFSVLYDDRFIEATSSSAESMKFTKSGTVELSNNDGSFKIEISGNNDMNQQLDTYCVSGNSQGNVLVKAAGHGISIAGEDLDGVVVKSFLGDAEEKIVLDGDSDRVIVRKEEDSFNLVVKPYEACLGDVNDDGEINVLDLMYLANYFAKGEIINQANADVNGDGLLDVRDLMFLANVFAGKETLG